MVSSPLEQLRILSVRPLNILDQLLRVPNGVEKISRRDASVVPVAKCPQSSRLIGDRNMSRPPGPSGVPDVLDRAPEMGAVPIDQRH